MTQDNRESWLNRVAAGMAPLFEALDAPCPRACAWRSASPARAQGQGDRRVLGQPLERGRAF
jgi:hypothetical protein